ncbi:anion permease [candidate division WOR-3 bacterium]|nr:anion permease [candidate division WOR-3 bacterium]
MPFPTYAGVLLWQVFYVVSIVLARKRNNNYFLLVSGSGLLALSLFCRISQVNEMFFSSFVFLNIYVFFIFLEKHKALASWFAVASLFSFRLLDLDSAFGFAFQNGEILYRGVNWNIVGIFTGTMILADLFMKSRAPEFISEKITKKASTAGFALVLVSAFSGAISIFCENVAALLIVAPVAFSIAEKLKVSPLPFLVSSAVFSNLEGASTLIGDPPSIILAVNTGMNFNDFFFKLGRPGIFFAVQLGALAGLSFLYFKFKNLKQPLEKVEETKVLSWVPAFLLIFLTLGLVFLSVLKLGFDFTGGILCMILASSGLFFWKLKQRKTNTLRRILREFDFETVFLLMGIFILVSGLSKAGVIETVAAFIGDKTRGNFTLTFVFFALSSMLFSAFIDNVPFVSAMIPICISMSSHIGFDQIQSLSLAFAVTLGASIGGNITPVGASSNIVAVGLLRKRGYKVPFLDFVKIGLPFTLFSTLASVAFIYLFWR